MLRAGHCISDRIQQTGEIVFGKGTRKWWGPMAKAIGIKRGDLDRYMRADWSPEEQDQINVFLACMLEREAVSAACADRNEALAADISNLAAQYRAPRHRPVIPPAPGSDTGQEFIGTIPDEELVPDGTVEPMADWYERGWAEIIAADD